METISTKRDLLETIDAGKCLAALRDGRIVCYPTETFYALGIDYFDPEATERLYILKGRPSEKAFPCIAADRAQVETFCDTSHPAFSLLVSRFWPGPLTLVLPSRKRPGSSIAVRVSSHPVARQLASALGSLLVSTSANRSGEEPIMNMQVLPSDLKQGISVAIDGGLAKGGEPSTIISLAVPAPRILREGAISSAALREFL